MHIIEGLTENLGHLGIAAAICGLTAWMVSTGPRYFGQAYKGAARGLIFGLLMLLPLVTLMPFYFWPLIPDWVYTAWIVGVMFYEIAMWTLMLRYRSVRIKDPQPKSSNSTLEMNSGVTF